ncbi:MAG: hypothetical protein QXW98_04105 [Candidatus Caldarchaeum sp.]
MAMSAIYSTGPAAVIVGFGTYDMSIGQIVHGSFVLLGWAERSPVINQICAATPLFNTLGGVELPYAYMPQGSEFEITVTLTRWNDILLSVLRNAYSDGGTAFYSTYFIFGSLVFGLYIYYPLLHLTNNPVHRHADYFPVTRIARVTLHDMGNQPEKVDVTFHAMRGHLLPLQITTPLDPVFGSMTSGLAVSATNTAMLPRGAATTPYPAYPMTFATI